MVKSHNRLARPFLKWAGGKRQLLPELEKYIPKSFDVYYEPFVGAGAMLFHLQPKRAVISDINSELINCYYVIRDSLCELLEDLHRHERTEKYYYRIRGIDRDEDAFKRLSDVQRASRVIFLNKTCYNGLFRVNSKGEFNVPFGRYRNPKIVDKPALEAVNRYLNTHDVVILNQDFEKVVQDARKGDFVYFDPPYDPVSDTAAFTGYDVNGFGREEQKRLKRVYDELTRDGVRCLLSNSATPFILALYQDYEIITVQVSRSINSVSSRRGKVDEVIVKNW